MPSRLAPHVHSSGVVTASKPNIQHEPPRAQLEVFTRPPPAKQALSPVPKPEPALAPDYELARQIQADRDREKRHPRSAGVPGLLALIDEAARDILVLSQRIATVRDEVQGRG